MNSGKGVASPSAIDCICCALGGAILLWLATIAVNAKQTEGIQSLVLVSFELRYSEDPHSEKWSLNETELAVFNPQNEVEPRWPAWERNKKTAASFRFASVDPALEVVSFFGTENKSTGASILRLARRSILIQNIESKAIARISIDWHLKPTEVKIRLVSNGYETIEKTVPADRIGNRGIEVQAEPGELFDAEPLE